MIYRTYLGDDSPDLPNWVVECDRCGRQVRFADLTRDWLLGRFPVALAYCPPCTALTAAEALAEVWPS